MTSPSSPSGFYREKLSPERIAELRGMVEGTSFSFRRIGEAMGLSASTVSRYATEGGWQRPDPPAGSAPAATPSPAPRTARHRRDQIADKLWRLAERHAEVLEDQPIEVAQRALQPLARLTRTLGEMDKHAHPPLPTGQYEIDNQPRRSLSELRDELVAHLERIEREEGQHWDIREWWFSHGGGI